MDTDTRIGYHNSRSKYRKDKAKMKVKHWIIALLLAVILGIALFAFTDDTLDIDETEVSRVSLYCYCESCMKKKIVTETEDIRAVIKEINSCHSWGKHDSNDFPSGGLVYYLVLECGDAAKVVVYNQTGRDGRGFLTDDDGLIKVSGLNLTELWDSLDYEEIEASSAAELFSDQYSFIQPNR